MKTVLLFLMALPLLAQNPSNQDLDILGHFNMAAGTWSAPFIPISVDPTGACTTANAVVINTTTGQLTGCIALIWTPLGGAGSGNVSGPGSSTNFALAAWNGTSGLLLRNTSVITDGSGNLTANSLTTSGGGAGTIGLTQGTVQGSFPANSVSLYAPATISSAYQWKLPAADSAGVIASDGAGTPGTLSILSVPSCVDSGGNHLNYNTSTHVFSCGVSGGTAGSAAFNTITSGTNTTATMTVGTGGSLTFSGSGTVNANLISGSSPAASATTDTTSASNISSGTLAVARGGTGTGSTLTGLVRGNSSAFTAAELSGDCTTSGSNAITCTKTSGSSFVASATTDTTNASNISSGTLGAARLPNPSASTLGGIESIAAVSHNFLTSISTSGVPAQAQPAFSDLSGSATAAQLPNPTASTLGGIESLAAVSHSWINTISTSGVPSATRPACADLSDSAASCATDATNAANISSGALPAGRMPALTGDVTSSAGAVATTIAANAVTSAKSAVVNTRRVCSIVIGADNSTAALVSADLAPQGRQCFVPFAATVVEVTVAGDAGTPNVVVAKNHAGSLSDFTSSALATASAGALACSNTGGTTGIDGTTTCSATLQNTSLAAGDWIETHSATAGGTAKRMSIAVVYTVN